MVKIRKLSDSNQGSWVGRPVRSPGGPRALLPGLSLWTHSHSRYPVPLTHLPGITGFKK